MNITPTGTESFELELSSGAKFQIEEYTPDCMRIRPIRSVAMHLAGYNLNAKFFDEKVGTFENLEVSIEEEGR